MYYRVTGGRIPRFVDLDLGSSPGWWAATVATYCPSRMVELPKSKSTQPRYSTTRVTLYVRPLYLSLSQEKGNLPPNLHVQPRAKRFDPFSEEADPERELDRDELYKDRSSRKTDSQ